MSTPQTYELGWLSYLSNILSPHWPKSGGSKKFVLASLAEFAHPPLSEPLTMNACLMCVCSIVRRCSTRRPWWTSVSWKLPRYFPRWTASCSRTQTAWPRTIDYWWDVIHGLTTTRSHSTAGDTSRDGITVRCILFNPGAWFTEKS